MLRIWKGLLARLRFERPTRLSSTLGAEAPTVWRPCRSVLRCIGPFRSGYDIVRILLAALLLVAAGLKGYQLATEPVVGTGLLEARWFLICVVEFELFFGLWLFSGLLPRLTRAGALGCFGLFACVSLYKALAGYASCGCFGPVKVNPWYTSILDASAVLALLWWRPGGLFQFSPQVILSAAKDFLRNGNTRIAFPIASATTVLLLWLLVGVPAAVAMGGYPETTLSDAGEVVGHGKIVVLEPERWINKRFPLLPFIEDAPSGLQVGQEPLRKRLADGNWIVVLYHHDCRKCEEKMPEFRELVKRAAMDSTAPQVAFVEVPPYADLNALPIVGGCSFGRLAGGKEWFVETPVEMQLRSALVIPTDGARGTFSQE